MPVRALLGTLFIFLGCSSSGWGTTLRLMSLEDLLSASSRVVVGECLQFHEGVDGRGLPFTQYDFRLVDQLKGVPKGKLLTVKQFGRVTAPTQRGEVRSVVRIEGMPHYRPGETYLLFLGPDSRWGFTSPIGLAQGAFLVTGTGSNRRLVNSLDNRNLGLDTSQSVREKVSERRLQMRQSGTPRLADEPVRGPVSLVDFTEVLRRLSAGEHLDERRLNEALSEGGNRR